MDHRVTSVSREESKRQGAVVLEPGSLEQIYGLLDSDYALVELRNLFPLKTGGDPNFGVIATEKISGEQKIILEAVSCCDAGGFYFMFSSKAVVEEAVLRGKNWAYKRLTTRFGINPMHNPRKFEKSVQIQQFEQSRRDNAFALLTAVLAATQETEEEPLFIPIESSWVQLENTFESNAGETFESDKGEEEPLFIPIDNVDLPHFQPRATPQNDPPENSHSLFKSVKKDQKAKKGRFKLFDEYRSRWMK